MISITAVLLILLFYGWSKLGDEGIEPKQPYIHKEPRLLLMAPNDEGGENTMWEQVTLWVKRNPLGVIIGVSEIDPNSVDGGLTSDPVQNADSRTSHSDSRKDNVRA